MKKIIIWILIVLLAASLAGCGAKKKRGGKVGEALAEKIIEEAGGSDVDIDGDTVKIKGENGEEMIFGETEWPISNLAKNIPEFKVGKVVTVMEMNNSLLITLEGASKDDFLDYLDEIKKTFTEEVYDMKLEDGVTYGAENGKGIGVMLMYVADESLSITVTQLEPQE